MPDLDSIARLIVEEQAKELALAKTADEAKDPVNWITKNFYIPELKGPITLAPYQKACLREALSRDQNGLFRYSMIAWVDIKKSAKTTIAAAVASWIAYGKARAKIRFVGNDLKQADSRVFNALTDAIGLNPRWRTSVRIRQHLVNFPNGSVIESVPVDPGGEAGGNDDMIEWTETWAATGEAHQKLWAELTLSPTKFGQSFRWTDTYAGYVGESPILESIYELGVTNGRHLDLSFTDDTGYHDLSDLEVFVNDSARMFVLWNTIPRLSWQGVDYYRQEAATLPENEFQRMHRNQWINSAKDPFVPAEWWDACQGDVPKLTGHESMFIGMDAGISNDYFGMVMVSRHGGKVAVRYSRTWKPPKGGKVEFSNKDNPSDTNFPEGELRRLVNQYNVLEVAFDPYQLYDMSVRLSGLVKWTEIKQSSDRSLADKQLRDAIQDRRIIHDGSGELGTHIKNANVKTEKTKEGEKEQSRLRIVKRTGKLKIDLAVSLSMAVFRALDGQTTLADGWIKSLKQQPDVVTSQVKQKQTLQELAKDPRVLGLPEIGKPLPRMWNPFKR